MFSFNKFSLLWWVAAACIMLAAIFLLSADPHSYETTGRLFGAEFNTLARKTAHFLEYAFLSLLSRQIIISAGQRVGMRLIPARLHFAVLTIVTCFAGLDEYHQSFVPGRHACLDDVLLDSSGAIAALLMMETIIVLRRARFRKPNFFAPDLVAERT